MKKNIESIKQTLDAKDAEYKKFVINGKTEIAKTEAKIKELEAKKEKPESLDDYKITSQELRDARDYLSYLHEKTKSTTGSMLSSSEYKEMEKEIISEITEIQAEAAPEIEQAVMQAVNLMTAYNERIMDLTGIMDHAKRLYTPTLVIGAKNYGEGLINQDKSRAKWLEQFVYMFYRYLNEAQRLEGKLPNHIGIK